MSAPTGSKLAQAARHVAEGRMVVVRQRALVTKLKERGQDTLNPEKLLDQFERTLAIFEDHLREIEMESATKTIAGISRAKSPTPAAP